MALNWNPHELVRITTIDLVGKTLQVPAGGELNFDTRVIAMIFASATGRYRGIAALQAAGLVALRVRRVQPDGTIKLVPLPEDTAA